MTTVSGGQCQTGLYPSEAVQTRDIGTKSPILIASVVIGLFCPPESRCLARVGLAIRILSLVDVDTAVLPASIHHIHRLVACPGRGTACTRRSTPTAPPRAASAPDAVYSRSCSACGLVVPIPNRQNVPSGCCERSQGSAVDSEMGKTEPPPSPLVAVAVLVPLPRPLPLLALSHLSSQWHTAASPQNNMAFLFCIFCRYFSPTHRASHCPPPESCHPVTLSSPPASSIPPDGPRGLEKVVAVQFPSFADASFCQMLPHPDGADQPCHRRVLIVVRCPVSAGHEAVSHPPPFPPPESNPNPCCWTPSAHGAAMVCCRMATMHPFPIPHPAHPLPSNRTTSRILCIFPFLLVWELAVHSRSVFPTPPSQAEPFRPNLVYDTRLSLHYPHLRLIGTA